MRCSVQYATIQVPEEVPKSVVGVPEEAVDGVEDVCQEAELGLGGGQQGEEHQGEEQEGGPGSRGSNWEAEDLTGRQGSSQTSKRAGKTGGVFITKFWTLAMF